VKKKKKKARWMEHELTLEISSKTLNQFRLEIPAGFFFLFYHFD
jgi:hypothetical protein